MVRSEITGGTINPHGLTDRESVDSLELDRLGKNIIIGDEGLAYQMTSELAENLEFDRLAQIVKTGDKGLIYFLAKNIDSNNLITKNEKIRQVAVERVKSLFLSKERDDIFLANALEELFLDHESEEMGDLVKSAVVMQLGANNPAKAYDLLNTISYYSGLEKKDIEDLYFTAKESVYRYLEEGDVMAATDALTFFYKRSRGTPGLFGKSFEFEPGKEKSLLIGIEKLLASGYFNSAESLRRNFLGEEGKVVLQSQEAIEECKKEMANILEQGNRWLPCKVVDLYLGGREGGLESSEVAGAIQYSQAGLLEEGNIVEAADLYKKLLGEESFTQDYNESEYWDLAKEMGFFRLDYKEQTDLSLRDGLTVNKKREQLESKIIENKELFQKALTEKPLIGLKVLKFLTDHGGVRLMTFAFDILFDNKATFQKNSSLYEQYLQLAVDKPHNHYEETQTAIDYLANQSKKRESDPKQHFSTNILLSLLNKYDTDDKRFDSLADMFIRESRAETDTQKKQSYARYIAKELGTTTGRGHRHRERGGYLLSGIMGVDRKKIEQFEDIWSKATTAEEVESYRLKNIEKILELERRQQGAPKTLNSDFGMVNFARWDMTQLERQYEQRNDRSRPFGIVVFPMADWNGAFNSDRGIDSLGKISKEKINLRIFETGSNFGLGKILARCRQKFNPDGNGPKISYMILGGHGSRDTINFNEGNDLRTSDLSSMNVKPRPWNRFPRKGDEIRSWGTGIYNKVKNYFVEKPTIILLSCSTGQQGGIGQRISFLTRSEVHAPIKPVSSSLTSQLIQDEKGDPQIKFNVNYLDDGKQIDGLKHIYSRGRLEKVE